MRIFMSDKRLKLSTIYAALLTAVAVVLWLVFFKSVNLYITCTAVILLAILPLFIRAEKKAFSPREITLTATLIALAVGSRAVFYLLPQIKPIGAVVIVCAVCLGAERGYFIGVMSAFISNFIFGQGVWTPFQMLALGLVGLIAGLTMKPGVDRWILSIEGFLLTFALYGAITDFSTVFMAYGNRITLAGLISVYGAGIVFSLMFGGATAVFLFLFGKPFITKLERIRIKYL
jgi:energy-coupling factor transport system substrate-specific component